MNHNPMTRELSSVLFAIAFAVPITFGIVPQVQPPPTPPEEIVADAISWRCNRTLQYVDETNYLRASIAIDTKKKRVHVSYRAKAGPGVFNPARPVRESVSFVPTAVCRSRTNPRGFYVAGKSSTQAVVEFWEFNDDESLSNQWQSPPGTWATDFSPPTINRTPLSVSPSLGWPCDMTAVSPCTVSGASEELWIMEWESRNVYGLNPTTGALTLRVPAVTVSAYRSMDAETHSIYGDVVMFRRRPWQASEAGWSFRVYDDPTVDTDMIVLYDQDLNGTMEGGITIPAAMYQSHAIFTTGTWTDMEQ